MKSLEYVLCFVCLFFFGGGAGVGEIIIITPFHQEGKLDKKAKEGKLVMVAF